MITRIGTGNAMGAQMLIPRRVLFPKGKIVPLAFGDDILLAVNDTGSDRYVVLHDEEGWYRYPTVLTDVIAELSNGKEYSVIVARSSRAVWFSCERGIIHLTFDNRWRVHLRVLEIPNGWRLVDATDEACLAVEGNVFTRLRLAGEQLIEEAHYDIPERIDEIYKLPDDQGLFIVSSSTSKSNLAFIHITPGWDRHSVRMPDPLLRFGGYFLSPRKVGVDEVVVSYTKNPASEEQWKVMRVIGDVTPESIAGVFEIADKRFLVIRRGGSHPNLAKQSWLELYRVQSDSSMRLEIGRIDRGSYVFAWRGYLCIASPREVAIGDVRSGFVVFDPHKDGWSNDLPRNGCAVARTDESGRITGKAIFWIHIPKRIPRQTKTLEILPNAAGDGSLPSRIEQLTILRDMVFAVDRHNKKLHGSYGNPYWLSYDLNHPELEVSYDHELIPFLEGVGFWMNNSRPWTSNSCIYQCRIERDGTLILHAYDLFGHSLRFTRGGIHWFVNSRHVVAFAQEGGMLKEVFRTRLNGTLYEIAPCYSTGGAIAILVARPPAHLSLDGKVSEISLPDGLKGVDIGYSNGLFFGYDNTQGMLYYTSDMLMGWSRARLKDRIGEGAVTCILETSGGQFVLISDWRRKQTKLCSLPQHEHEDAVEILTIDALVEGSMFKDLIILYRVHTEEEEIRLHFKDGDVLSMKGNLLVYNTREYRVSNNFRFPRMVGSRSLLSNIEIPSTWTQEQTTRSLYP